MASTLPRTHTALRSVGWLVAAQLVTSISSWLLAILLARYLGAEGYGEWSLALAFVMLFWPVADFGLSMLALRELSQAPKETARFIGNAATIEVVLALGLFGIMIGLRPLISGDATVRNLVFLLGAGSLLTAFNQLLFAVFRVFEHTRLETACRIVQGGALLIATVALIAGGARIELFGSAYVGAAGLATLTALGLILGRFARIRPRLEPEFWRQMLSRALPLGSAAVLSFVYIYFGSVMLGILESARSVGLYNSAFVLVFALQTLLTAVRNAYLSPQSRAYATGPRQESPVFLEHMRLSALLAAPVGIALPVVAEPVLRLLYGAEYGAAANALRLLSATAFLMVFSSFYSSALLSAARDRPYLLVTVIGAMAHFALNPLLIPVLGLEGAALSGIIAQMLALAAFYHQARDLALPSMWPALLPPAIYAAAAAAAMLAVLTVAHVLVAGAVFCAIYVALVFRGRWTRTWFTARDLSTEQIA